MKVKLQIVMKKKPRHLHYFMNISWMHNLHTFNIAKMSKVFGRHFVMCMKPRLSETSCFFKGGFSLSKCKKGKTCLRTSTWWKHLRINYVPLRWRLKMKTCTWYFSWTFPHLLIIWSRVSSPCPPKMLTFNSLSFNCFMRFSERKENESMGNVALFNKIHKANEKLCFYCKKRGHFVMNYLKKKWWKRKGKLNLWRSRTNVCCHLEC